MARLRKKNINSFGAGTFVVPAGVTRIWIFGHGAAGGGGGGCSGANASTAGQAGGGGGGGAGESSSEWWDVIPGETLTYFLGSGGNGGAASGSLGLVAGNAGSGGSGTTISNQAGTKALLWHGGTGGFGGTNSFGAAGGGRNKEIGDNTVDQGVFVVLAPGFGGTGSYSSAVASYGSCVNGNYSGMCPGRINNAFAGVKGVFPGDSGSYHSGGPGGGGGFGEWPVYNQVPGFGGNGGTANSGGAALSSGTGGAFGGQTHGGGGGGGGACASGTGSLGGNGGQGGAGALMFVWVE